MSLARTATKEDSMHICTQDAESIDIMISELHRIGKSPTAGWTVAPILIGVIAELQLARDRLHRLAHDGAWDIGGGNTS